MESEVKCHGQCRTHWVSDWNRKLLHQPQTSADKRYHHTITNCRTQCRTQWHVQCPIKACAQWPMKTNQDFHSTKCSFAQLRQFCNLTIFYLIFAKFLVWFKAFWKADHITGILCCWNSTWKIGFQVSTPAEWQPNSGIFSLTAYKVGTTGCPSC